MHNFPRKAIILSACLSICMLAAALARAQTAKVAVPGLEAIGRAQLVGHRDPTSVLNVDVLLKLRNQPQLQSFLAALQDPSNSEYHQFLTPKQFTDQYGPTQAQVKTVTDWLKSQGLTVTGVTPNRLTIHVRAAGGAFEQAFGIRINDYRYQGRSVYGPAKAPQLPSAVAGEVTAILGLSNIVRPRPMSIGSNKPSAEPHCDISRVTYAPVQIALAYDWIPIGDTNYGAGVTIAIASMDSPDFSPSDPDTFWSHYGLPQHSVTLIPVGAPSSATDGNFETTLDAEWAGTMAPGADLLIYVGYPSAGTGAKNLHDVMSQIVTDDQAQIMTVSWGPLLESANHQLFMDAAAEGMTVVVASGDEGGEPQFATSTDPLVASAGGTRLLLKEDNSIQSEVVWNDDWGATGGTVSTVFPEPSWQYGPGVPQNGWRNTNDLSMDADECTGYHVYFQGDGTWYGGGTSFVSPELAGLFADFVSLTNNERLGQVNPALYADARAHYATDIHDITQGNNDPYSAGPGWDHPTGWGTPDAAQLLNHLEGGIALAAPWIFFAQFDDCFHHAAQYTVSWQPGPIGTPSAYEVDREVGNTWEPLYQGPLRTVTAIFATGVTQLRGRSSNGQFWTRYAHWQLHARPCLGGPGGGGPP